MRRCGYARCEARKSHDLGLQVSYRVDNEVPVSCVGGRCRATGAGVAAGNRAGARDEHLRWSDQSRSCAYADRDTAASVGVSGGAISQRQELAQTAVGISVASQTVLGSASLGSGLLGGHEAGAFLDGAGVRLQPREIRRANVRRPLPLFIDLGRNGRNFGLFGCNGGRIYAMPARTATISPRAMLRRWASVSAFMPRPLRKCRA